MSNAKKNMTVRELIRRGIKLIPVSDGDVVLIKKGSPLASGRGLEQFVNAMYKTHRTKAIAVVVDDFDDLDVIDEKAMNGLGWYKINAEDKSPITTTAE